MARHRRQGVAQPLTPAQVKRQLWLKGRTLKAWASENGYAYSTVSAVMSGKIKLTRNYGTGYDIAVKLGLVVDYDSERDALIAQSK
jgi:gp16 family phage-associated protein